MKKIPEEFARSLHLEDPRMYTSHCFRCTGATLLADANIKLLLFILAGRWHSTSIGLEYIAQSKPLKRKIVEKLAFSRKLSRRKRLRRKQIKEKGKGNNYNFLGCIFINVSKLKEQQEAEMIWQDETFLQEVFQTVHEAEVQYSTGEERKNKEEEEEEEESSE